MALTDEEVVHLINQATDFPKLSSTAAEIAQLTLDLSVPVKDVADRIGSDAELSKKMLEVVNSGFYKLAAPASSIEEAIQLLGYKKMCNLASALTSFLTSPRNLAARSITPDSGSAPSVTGWLPQRSLRNFLRICLPTFLRSVCSRTSVFCSLCSISLWNTVPRSGFPKARVPIWFWPSRIQSGSTTRKSALCFAGSGNCQSFWATPY